MESGNAKVEGGVGGVLIYTLSMPGVHFLTVIPGGVYCTSKDREVGCVLGVAGKVIYDTGLGLMFEWFYMWRILSRKARRKV